LPPIGIDGGGTFTDKAARRRGHRAHLQVALGAGPSLVEAMIKS
jgi:hypothetical protein